jgi:hypothetical protein
MDKFSVLFLSLLLLMIPLFFNFVLGGISWSTYNFFNVTNTTLFNWTTSNITIGSWNDSIQININNVSTEIVSSYNQKSRASSDAYYTSYNCFHGGNGLIFVVKNQTGSYVNNTQTINNGTIEEFILLYYPYCPPGKYSGNFTVSRLDNSSDIAKVSTVINIPISLNNTLNNATNSAFFRGTMSSGNQYHSYYYNTGEFKENITSLTMILTGLTNDVDLFVFNSSGFLEGKSIEKDTASEQILDIDLPSNSDIWEIRVYGNVSSSYDGYLYFITLNFTNTTNPDKQINSLDFGDLDTNATSSMNYTVKNQDDRVLTSVYDYAEIYHVQTWSRSNITKSFNDFFVPRFAQKIKVMINWTDETGKTITDWNLFLKDPLGNLIGNSTDKFLISNVTNATKEEFIVFTGPFNSTNEGLWNITIQNITNSTIPFSYYNITAYIWMNSNWINDNYNDGSNFNISANNSYNVTVNLTIPETQILDGKYEGFIKYNSSQGWNTILPLSFNVSAGTLFINNTINNATIRLIDNIGFNRIGANAITLNLTFNNTGSYPIYYTNSSSNNTLMKDSDSNITFTVDDWLPNPINPGINGKLNISISINTTLTGNDPGIYKGWFFFNATNSTLNSSSYPYKTFNLTLEVNITNALNVIVTNVTTADSDNWIVTPSNAENVTYLVNVYLINGTRLTDPNDAGTRDLYVENFTTAWMNETNVSSYSVYLSNINQTVQPGTPTSLCDPYYCSINATVPANKSGGRYDMSIKVRYNTSISILEGIGTYRPITVNSSGVNLNSSQGYTISSVAVSEGATTYVNITATNYGLLTANGNITFSSCSYATITPLASGGTNCNLNRDTGNNRYYSIGLGGNGASCYFAWSVYGNNISDNDKTCSYVLIWYNEPNLHNITINTLTVELVEEGATTTTVSSDNNGNQETSTTTIPVVTIKYLNITSYPSTVSVAQGTNKTERVTVNNINNTLAQKVNFTLLLIDSAWYSVYPSSATIANKTSYTFNVTFIIPENATVKDYSGKFFAESSYGGVNQDFTLRVTPGTKLQSQISANLSIYQNEINNLEKELNKTKNQNNTEAKTFFNQLKTKFNQASSYYNQSDYRSAYDLLDDMASLLNQTETALSLTGSKGFGLGINLGNLKGLGMWIIIGVVAIIAVVLAYLFWPTSSGGFKPQKGYTQESKDKKTVISGQLDKLKEKWRKAQERKE